MLNVQALAVTECPENAQNYNNACTIIILAPGATSAVLNGRWKQPYSCRMPP